MNEIESMDRQIQREVALKDYQGKDRIIYANDKWQEIQNEKQSRPPFRAMTGIPSLDSCVDGFRKGQLVVMSGPPKHGKSSMAQTFTKNFTDRGLKCLWFSYELGYEELFDKFPMEKMDFYVPNYMETGNVQWVEDKIIESTIKFNTEIVFIDHLDFLRDPQIIKVHGDHLSSYVGSIVQKIKRIAIERNVVIFLLSHIRKNEWKTNDTPTSVELADSRQTAQLADFVLMMVRKRAETNSDEIYDGTKAMLSVVENRHNGKTKKIFVHLDGKQFMETSVEKVYQDNLEKFNLKKDKEIEADKLF